MRLKLYTILKATIPFTPPLPDYYYAYEWDVVVILLFFHFFFFIHIGLTSALFVTVEKKQIFILWYFADNNLTATILSPAKKKKRMNCVNEIREGEKGNERTPRSRYNWIGCISMWRFDENKFYGITVKPKLAVFIQC